MKIKFIGHSSFLLTTDDGVRIVTDPYEAGSYDGAVKYGAVKDEADIVLVSHGHPDHNASGSVPGGPQVVETTGDHDVKGISIIGVPTYHDTEEGAQRGGNIIFSISADGLNVVHLGDLGHELEPAIANSIKPVDVLLLPVGGFFAIGPEEADSLIGALEPKLVIPMHYKTDGADFPIAPVEDFLEGRDNVSRPGSSEVEFSSGTVPSGVVVLEPANLP